MNTVNKFNICQKNAVKINKTLYYMILNTIFKESRFIAICTSALWLLRAQERETRHRLRVEKRCDMTNWHSLRIRNIAHLDIILVHPRSRWLGQFRKTQQFDGWLWLTPDLRIYSSIYTFILQSFDEHNCWSFICQISPKNKSLA